MARSYPLELHYGAQHRGLERFGEHSGKFAGRTTISAGSLTQVVTATFAESDSLITYGLQSTTASVSVVVSSINPGTGFVLSLAPNIAQTNDVVVMWRIAGQ